MKTILLSLAVAFFAFSYSHAQVRSHTGRGSKTALHRIKAKPSPTTQFRTESSRVSLDSIVSAKHHKETYRYDANGNDTLEVDFNWDSTNGVWKSYQKYEYVFDANNNETLFAQYLWDSTTQLKGIYKYTYMVDAKGNDTLIIGYAWNTKSNQWRQSSKIERGYDAKGNDTLQIVYDWDTTANQWVKSEKDQYAFDANGNQTLSAYYTWNLNTQQWVGTGKDITVYDAYGNKTNYIEYNWDGNSNQWVANYTNNYNSTLNAGHLPTVTIQTYQLGSTAYNNSKTEFTYDANGKVTLSTYYTWNSNSSEWVLSSKNEYGYNADEDDTLHANYIWISAKNRWEGEEKIQHGYDANGNLILFAQYDSWDTTSSQWAGKYKYSYGYDPSISSSSLATPFSQGAGDGFYFNNKLTFLADVFWSNGGWNTVYPYLLYYSDGVAGITQNQIAGSTTMLYPNPCKDVLTIQSATETTGYDIMSTTGAVLKSYRGSAQSIETSQLPSGAYFLKLTSTTDSRVYKFIKE